MTRPETEEAPVKRRHLALFWDMFRIALFVIGGGYAIIAVADAVFSRKRKVVSEGELLGALPVFQMVPGIMAAHAAVYVGRKTGGFAGSLAALAGVALPSVIVFSAVSAGYDFIPLGRAAPASAAREPANPPVLRPTYTAA